RAGDRPVDGLPEGDAGARLARRPAGRPRPASGTRRGHPAVAGPRRTGLAAVAPHPPPPAAGPTAPRPGRPARRPPRAPRPAPTARRRGEPAGPARRALVLALGEYGDGRLPPRAAEGLRAWLLEAYRTEPDPGLHGAAAWALRRLKQDGEVADLDKALAGGGP